MRIAYSALLALLLCGAFAFAAELPALALTDLSDARAVTLQDFMGQPVIALLWRSDCAPCQIELRRLPQTARRHPETTFLLIALEDASTARRALDIDALPANMHVLTAQQDDATVFTALGNARRVLPFSISLTPDGAQCRTHYGILTPDRITKWIATCNT